MPGEDCFGDDVMSNQAISELPESTAIDVVVLSPSSADRITGLPNAWIDKRSTRVDEQTRQAITACAVS